MRYDKIQTVWLRDPDNKFKTLLENAWAWPEFEYLQYNEWEFTEKVDGTNIRVSWDRERVTFDGRDENSQIPAPLINVLTEMFPASEMAKKFDSPTTLYGEGYGPKIQKGGGNYGKNPSFALFDVKIGDVWLRRHSVEDIATGLDIDVVPVIGEGNLHDMVKMVRQGITSQWGDFRAEGIVARPKTTLFTRMGKRIITKLKCKDFAQAA